MIGVVEKFSAGCWLLAIQPDCKRDGRDGEINGFM
jgi:hypothetical protein